MRCPKCDALMNRHAEKPLKNSQGEESQSPSTDADIGGAILAVHYCPRCGKIEAVKEWSDF